MRWRGDPGCCAWSISIPNHFGRDARGRDGCPGFPARVLASPGVLEGWGWLHLGVPWCWQGPLPDGGMCIKAHAAVCLCWVASNPVLPQCGAPRSHPGPGRKEMTPERAWRWWCRTCGAWGGGLCIPVPVVVGHGAITQMQWGELCPLCGHLLRETPISVPPFAPPHPTPSQGLCFNAAPQDGDGEQQLPAALPHPAASRDRHTSHHAFGARPTAQCGTPVGHCSPTDLSCRGRSPRCHQRCTAQSDPTAAALRSLGSRDP